MKYPLLNISLPKWDYEIAEFAFIFENETYQSKNDTYFYEFYQNCQYVDCCGKIYTLISKEPSGNKVSKLLRLKRDRFIFKETNQYAGFEFIKQYLTKRIGELNDDVMRKHWLDSISG